MGDKFENETATENSIEARSDTHSNLFNYLHHCKDYFSKKQASQERYRVFAMVKSVVTAIILAFSSLHVNHGAFAFTMSTRGPRAIDSNLSSRRSFLSTTAASVTAASLIGAAQPQPSMAVTAKEIITTPSGIKYAVTKEPTDKKLVAPLSGDIVAIEYTGYLANGQIFDATHSEGKSNALLFKLGSGSVIPGLEEMVSLMVVGQKVQCIIPANLAYGEKGVCLEDGECLIKPGSTLVYDVYLKRSSIPPP